MSQFRSSERDVVHSYIEAVCSGETPLVCAITGLHLLSPNRSGTVFM